MTKLTKTLMIVCLLTFVQNGLYAKYISIIDAGSSGSRIWLFNVNFNSENGAVNVDTVKLDNSKVTGGIAAYANNPKDVGNYINQLIKSLRAGVEAKKPIGYSEETTPIYLLATAGMRTVSPSNQDAVYSEVKKYFDENTSFCEKKAETISGEMEGVFDWLAVNCNKISRTGKTTVGVMDMGGASMQVVYATNDSSGKLVKNVKVGDTDPITYNVYSRSYLGLGADYARYQYSDDGNCFFKGFPMPDEGEGTGEYGAGLVDVDRLLNSVARVDRIPFGSIPVSGFCAISAFCTIAKSEHFKLDSISISSMEIKGEEFAKNSTWQSLVSEAAKNPYLFSILFTSQHIIEVLRDLGFPSDKEIQLSDASWPIGAAIYLTYNFPPQQLLQGMNLLSAGREDAVNLMAVQGTWGDAM